MFQHVVHVFPLYRTPCAWQTDGWDDRITRPRMTMKAFDVNFTVLWNVAMESASPSRTRRPGGGAGLPSGWSLRRLSHAALMPDKLCPRKVHSEICNGPRADFVVHNGASGPSRADGLIVDQEQLKCVCLDDSAVPQIRTFTDAVHTVVKAIFEAPQNLSRRFSRSTNQNIHRHV